MRPLAILACILVLPFGAVYPADARPQAAFPQRLLIDARGRTHELALTGYAERVIFFFRVYDMAHYIETTSLEDADLTHRGVLDEGPAKAITISFARTLGQDQIRKEFDKSLRRNARDEWLDQARATIRRFTASIDRDATEGDRLTFYWLPSGRVLAEFNGERVFSADDPAFAKLVWSIWFGKDPVCDVDGLLVRSAVEAL